MRQLGIIAVLLLAASAMAQTTLMGSHSILNLDSNGNSLGQAYRETAATSGTAAQINFYVDPSSTSTLADIGIYSGSRSAPNALLTHARFVPVNGTWNPIRLPPVAITKGQTYWIAVVGLVGSRLEYRDGAGSCPSPGMKGLSGGLAAQWITTYHWSQCGISAYVLSVVAPPPPVGISIAPTTLNLNTGATFQFTDHVSGTGNTAVTWGAILGSVTATGLYTAPAAAGTDTVTVTSQADTTKSAKATVSVTVPKPPVQHTATLAWTASTSVVTGYDLYRGTTSGGPYTLLNAALDPASPYVDNTVASGTIYFYVATAVDGSGIQSVNSNEAEAVIPSP